MPRFYGDDLERKKMWTRISNGIQASLSKSNGSVDSFVQNILVFIHAKPEFLTKDVLLLSAIKGLVSIAETDDERTTDVNAELWQCFRDRHMLLIPLAKEKWEVRKKSLKKDGAK